MSVQRADLRPDDAPPGREPASTGAGVVAVRLGLATRACARIGEAESALQPRDAALLAWLALEGPTPRARLAELLWPDSDAEQARNALRQRLFQLRKLLGVDLLVGQATLALAAGVTHDLEDSDQVLGDSSPVPAGPFLAWLDRQRERRRARLRQSLVELAQMAEGAGDWGDALSHAQELLALEPLSEDAHRRLMRLHYLAGDRAAALLAFDRCERLLKDEVGATPSAETMALLRTVEQAGAAGPAAPAAAPAAPRRVPAAVLRPPRLIGRDRQRAALHQAWDEGRCAIVRAEAGMGKSRLLADFALERGPVLAASARPGDERVVYASVTRLLRQWPMAAWQALDAGLTQELARLLPELGSPPAGAVDATRLFSACAAALDQVGPGLAGIVVDDLHFADGASVELLRHAAAGSARPWLLASRPAEGEPAARAWVDDLRQQGEAVAVELPPLTQAEVAELVESLALPGLGGAEHAAALWRRTGGNPLFLLETVKAGLMAGTALVPAALPAAAGVGAMIARRIGQLSPQAVALARCAAVAAPDFSIDLAASVLGARTLDLADPWAELEAAQVLRDGVFAHDLIHEAAKASVPAPVARRLHGEIATFLQARDGEPARVAAHWALAERWAEAGRAWREAAGRSRRAGRATEETQLLAQAAEAFGCAGLADERFDALRQRASTLATNDVGDQARSAADALAAEARGEAQQLQALSVQLELAITRFEIEAVLALAPQAVAAAREQGDRAMALRFAIAWSGALGDARRVAEGVAVLEPFRAWADLEATAEQRWEFWEAYALALDYAGRLRDSIQGWELCQEVARSSGRADLLWRSMSNAAAGQAKLGRVSQAVEVSEQARRIAIATGEVGRIRLLQMQTPHAHRLRDVGRYAEALVLLEEALEGLQADGSATDLTMTEQRLALLFLHLGQPARSHRLLATARPGLPPGTAMFHQVLQAEVAARMGQSVGARMRDAVALIPNPDDVFHRIGTLFASRHLPADEAEVMAASLAVWARGRERLGLSMAGHVRAAAAAGAQGAWARALPHVEAALELVREHQPESFYLGELWLVAGRVLHALGRADAAQRAWADGRDWVRELHDHHVPAAFRESFLQRNPVNLELMATGG